MTYNVFGGTLNLAQRNPIRATWAHQQGGAISVSVAPNQTPACAEKNLDMELVHHVVCFFTGTVIHLYYRGQTDKFC